MQNYTCMIIYAYIYAELYMYMHTFMQNYIHVHVYAGKHTLYSHLLLHTSPPARYSDHQQYYSSDGGCMIGRRNTACTLYSECTAPPTPPTPSTSKHTPKHAHAAAETNSQVDRSVLHHCDYIQFTCN